MSISNNFGNESLIGRISQRLLTTLFCAALAVNLAACGGTEGDDLEEPEEVGSSAEELKITCRQAERQYDSICHQYGNSSSQCNTAYDVLHCFCQNCAE